VVKFAWVLILCLTPASFAQQSSETQHQIWPELDLYFPLKEKFRLFAEISEQSSNESGSSSHGQVGIHLDYFWKKRWTLRAGYRYGFGIGSTDSFKEHRFLLEETYSKSIPRHFVVHARNRQEFRDVNDDFSMRFRTRLMLERDFAFGKRSLVPYVNGEVFYDTRFDALNRYRLTAGVQLFFKKRTSDLLKLRKQKTVDVYYLWQHDSRAQPEFIQALGVKFAIHY